MINEEVINEEDGFEDADKLKLMAGTIDEYWEQLAEQNIPASEYKERTYQHIKKLYPDCTTSQYDRTLHLFFRTESWTEFTNPTVYKNLQRSFLAYPNNVKQMAKMASVTERMASIYKNHWGSNGNKLSDDALEKFNQYYQSYLDLELHLTEFSEKVFNNPKCGQILLLHMKENYLISRYHYGSFKEKKDIRELEFTITGDYINKIFKTQNYRCAVTNIPLCSFYTSKHSGSKFVYSIDRLNNDLGYIPGNIRLITKTANMCRGPYTIEEHNELSILHVCNMIRNNEEIKKIYDPAPLEKLLLESNKTCAFDSSSNIKQNEIDEMDDLMPIRNRSPLRDESAYVYYAE